MSHSELHLAVSEDGTNLRLFSAAQMCSFEVFEIQIERGQAAPTSKQKGVFTYQ